MNKILVIFFVFFITSCKTYDIIERTTNKEYIGNVVEIKYLNGSTFIVIDKETSLLVKGKIQRLSDGACCYIVKEGSRKYLIFDGCTDRWILTR